MEGLLAAVKAFFDEWQEHAIFLIRAVKKGADVAFCAKHRAGEADRLVGFRVSFSSNIDRIIAGIHGALLSRDSTSGRAMTGFAADFRYSVTNARKCAKTRTGH